MKKIICQIKYKSIGVLATCDKLICRKGYYQEPKKKVIRRVKA